MNKKTNNYKSAWKGVLTLLGFGIFLACSNEMAKARPNIIRKDAPKPGVVAKINGVEITEEELIGTGKEQGDIAALNRNIYDVKMQRLNRLIIEKLIGDEAKKANMSLDEYLDKKIVKSEPKVSEAEARKALEEFGYPKERQNAQAIEQASMYLRMQKKQKIVQDYVAAATKKNPVEAYFKKPAAPKIEIGENTPVFGKKDAKVTIVEFSDFQCPACRMAAGPTAELKKKYGDKIQFAFRQFPLDGKHPRARPASEMSLCINEQGGEKFWKFHDLVFKNQEKMEDADLEKYAKDAGADVKKVKECLTAGKFKAKVDIDQQYGEKMGVDSTPSFFINGSIHKGALQFPQLAAIVDEELAE